MGILSTFSTHLTKSSSLPPPKYITSYTPSSRLPSLRTSILCSLPLLSLLGYYFTWHLCLSNGTYESILALISQPDSPFPGTKDLLIKKYVGWARIDRHLSILVTFFAPVSAFKHGDLGLFAVWGAGQRGACWIVLVMEALRMGNKGKVLSWIGITGLAFQSLSLAVITPLYLFLHLLTSPVSKPFPGTHANSVLLVPALDLRILPFSIVFAYLIPSILMCIPSPIVTNSTRQYLIATWVLFPLWTICFQSSIRFLCAQIVKRFWSEKAKSRPPAPQGASYLSNVKHVYRFILFLSISTHIPVLLLALTPSTLIPSQFTTIKSWCESTFTQVFIPYLPLPSYQVTSFAAGIHTYLLWDFCIASIAFLLWATLLYRNATTEKSIVDPNTCLPIYRELLVGERKGEGNEWRKLGVKIAGWSVLGGPMGALAVLLWERDAIVRQKLKQGI